MKRLIYFLLFFLCFASISASNNQGLAKLSIELDPAPYILGGYSVSVKYSPTFAAKTAFMASVYSSPFPDAMMSKVNREHGWHSMKIETSYALFAEFYSNERQRGFYFGPSVFLYSKSAVLQASDIRVYFKTFYPNIRAGYCWYPFKRSSLYLNPWLNIGSEIAFGADSYFKGIPFETQKLYYIAAVHVGYILKFNIKGAMR